MGMVYRFGKDAVQGLVQLWCEGGRRTTWLIMNCSEIPNNWISSAVQGRMRSEDVERRRNMKGLFIPDITSEMFRNGCLEGIEALMAEGEIYDIEYDPSAQPDIVACGDCIHWICHDRRCGYWNHGVKPLDWCCHAERRTDG